MSLSLRQALAHTGWLVSALALAALWVVTGGPALATPIAAAGSLLALVGSAVGVGVVWTLAQATIHTRLGSRPMLSDTPSPDPAVPVRRVLWLTAAIVAVLSCVELVFLAPLLELLAARSLASAAWGALGAVWRGLGGVVLVSVGLAFSAELAWSQVRDRLSARRPLLLPDRQR